METHCPQWKRLFLVEAILFTGSHLFHQKLLVLRENALLSRKYSFQLNPLFLVESIGLQQKSFHIVETVPFNGRHFLYWKLLLLLEAIHFSGNHSFQWKPFPVVEAIPFRESLCFSWKSLPLVKTIPSSRSHFFFMEAAPFNRNFSFFWKAFFFNVSSIFVSRSCHQLRELLNINDIVLDY